VTITWTDGADWLLSEDSELLELEVLIFLLRRLPALFFLETDLFLVLLVAVFLSCSLEEEPPPAEAYNVLIFSSPDDTAIRFLGADALFFACDDFFAGDLLDIELEEEEEDLAAGFRSFWVRAPLLLDRAPLLLVPSEEEESLVDEEDDSVVSLRASLGLAFSPRAVFFLSVCPAVFFEALDPFPSFSSLSDFFSPMRVQSSATPAAVVFFRPATAFRTVFCFAEEADPRLFRNLLLNLSRTLSEEDELSLALLRLLLLFDSCSPPPLSPQRQQLQQLQQRETNRIGMKRSSTTTAARTKVIQFSSEE